MDRGKIPSARGKAGGSAKPQTSPEQLDSVSKAHWLSEGCRRTAGAFLVLWAMAAGGHPAAPSGDTTAPRSAGSTQGPVAAPEMAVLGPCCICQGGTT